MCLNKVNAVVKYTLVFLVTIMRWSYHLGGCYTVYVYSQRHFVSKTLCPTPGSDTIIS